MKAWGVCALTVSLVLCAIALPVLSHPGDSGGGSEDLRAEVRWLKRKVLALEEEIAALRAENRAGKQSMASNPPDFGLSPEHSKIVAVRREEFRRRRESGDNPDVSEILRVREEILEILAPEQRIRYLEHLRSQGEDF